MALGRRLGIGTIALWGMIAANCGIILLAYAVY
jgi:hypothetical protein